MTRAFRLATRTGPWPAASGTSAPALVAANATTALAGAAGELALARVRLVRG